METGITNQNNYNDFFSFYKNNRIIIYGTGNVGERFYKALEKNNLQNNVFCFAVTDKRINVNNNFSNVPVISIDELHNYNDCIICVAVHEAILKEIKTELDKRNITNYIWIYPHIYQLYLGKPIKNMVYIPTDLLINSCDRYIIAVRYLTIEQYYNKNKCGYGIYVKAVGMSCDRNTAEKRLENFIKLIQTWENIGYDPEKTLYIDDNYYIFDGTHRLSLAKYFNVDRICCDVFQQNDQLIEWMDPKTLMCKAEFDNQTFSEEELKIIDETYHKLRGEST